MSKLPTVDDVRPRKCPGCGGIHGIEDCSICGHGLRKRQVWGPRELEGPPEKVAVLCRRFRCRGCRCVMQVVPAEVGYRLRYSLPAVTAALAMWALEKQRQDDVRAVFSPTIAARGGNPLTWPSLARWTRARDQLWPSLHISAEPTLRQTAARLVAATCARMPRAPPTPTVAAAWHAAGLAR